MMNDIDALEAFKKGDKKAFKFLFNKYYDRLVAYIMTYSHNKMISEDVVQQAFVSLWEGRDKLNDMRSPKNYLYAIAYNRYMDIVKKEKKQNNALSQIYERALQDRIVEDKEALELRVKKMNQIIETLPPKCKKILKMNKIEGVKYKNIAEIMGISLKTVESQMSIAYKKIRKGFENDKLILVFIDDFFSI
ncbi:RNA polymerase sigma-70 factor [uncultured Algibacter sp.]|uniref:RNA polymerase sigma factor n=1 Tax=uncultured Algibacter sp. TaxID=298659 RepID=UPI0032175274